MLKVFYLKLLRLVFARVCKEIAWNKILLLQGLFFADLIFYIIKERCCGNCRDGKKSVKYSENRVCGYEKKRLFFVWFFDICELQFGIVREVCYRLVLVSQFGDLLSLDALQLLDLICGSLFGLCTIGI